MTILKKIKRFFSKHTFQIIVLLETIILFLLVIIPLEYLLTEKFLIYRLISYRLKTCFFLGIFLLVFFLNYFWKRIFILGKLILGNILFLFIIMLFFNKSYLAYYDYLQKYPKIFSVAPNWGIQGMSIKIEGRGFGYPWQQGKVLIDDIELKIDSWSDNQINAILPVPPKFGVGKLKIVRFDNYESNKKDFEIRDPLKLQN